MLQLWGSSRHLEFTRTTNRIAQGWNQDSIKIQECISRKALSETGGTWKGRGVDEDWCYLSINKKYVAAQNLGRGLEWVHGKVGESEHLVEPIVVARLWQRRWIVVTLRGSLEHPSSLRVSTTVFWDWLQFIELTYRCSFIWSLSYCKPTVLLRFCLIWSEGSNFHPVWP